MLGRCLGESLEPGGGCEAPKSGKTTHLMGEGISGWNGDGVLMG